MLVRQQRTQERQKLGGKNPKYLKIDVDLELTMASSKGILEAVAKSNKKKVGSTTIKYAAAPAWDSTLVYRNDDDY